MQFEGRAIAEEDLPALIHAGPLEANDVNRTLMSLLAISFGATLAFSMPGHLIPGCVALALLITVVVLKRKFAKRRSDA